MRLLFFKAKYGNLADKIFAWLVSSPYSRAAISFSDGKTFTVDFKSGKLVLIRLGGFAEVQWDSLEVFKHEFVIRRWAEDHLGLRLCAWGKVFGFFEFFKLRRFSSYAVSLALTAGGYENLPHCPFPGRLYWWAKKWLCDCHEPPCPPLPYYRQKFRNVVYTETLTWE